MIPQPRTILRQLNEILHHPDVDTVPLRPHTITWEHHDDTPATNRYTRTASTSAPNMPPSTRYNQSSIRPRLKLHAPYHPAVKLAKQHPPAPQTSCPLEPAVKLANQHPPAPQSACPLAPGRQHPPAPQTALAPGRQARKAASTSTPHS